MRALIIDQCGNRAALPAARALKDDKWAVGVASPTSGGLARRSRAVDWTHFVPAAPVDTCSLVEAVNAAVQARGYEVLFPLDDVGVHQLSECRDQLSAIVPYGSRESVSKALDKLELTRLAISAGLAAPRTEISPEGAEELLESGRIVVKPRLTFSTRESGHMRSRIATNPTQARRYAMELQEAGTEPIFQEHIDGSLMALTILTDRDSRIVASIQQQSDRRWPVNAGISARAHAVPIDDALIEGAARLAAGIGWFGLAQLQFIVAGGESPRIIDFNGRFYGSLALAIASGLNLPAMWGRLALGLPPVGERRPLRAARYQWLAADLRSGIAESNDTLTIARSIAGSFMLATRATHSIWSSRDPGPAIVHLLNTARRWMPQR